MSLALWNPKTGTSSHRIWLYSGMILGLSRESSPRSPALFDNTGSLRTTSWWCNGEVAPETQKVMAALLFWGKHTNRALSLHPTLKIYLSSPSTILRHKCLVGLRKIISRSSSSSYHQPCLRGSLMLLSSDTGVSFSGTLHYSLFLMKWLELCVLWMTSISVK